MMPMQSYANHRQRVPLFLAICATFLAAFVWQAYHFVRNPTIGQFLDALVMAALVLLPFVLRRFTLRVQDRVIRLEMRLRLTEVLPPPMQGQIQKLTERHLIALRFAGDDELPSLVSEIAANPGMTSAAIKQRIRNWQADHFRA